LKRKRTRQHQNNINAIFFVEKNMNHRSNWQKRPSQHRAQHQPTGRVSHVVLSQREFVTRASCTFESRCPGDGVPLNLTLWQGKLHAGGSTMFHTFFFSHRMSCGNKQSRLDSRGKLSARLGCDGSNCHYLIST
jgi:hypothetical protein